MQSGGSAAPRSHSFLLPPPPRPTSPSRLRPVRLPPPPPPPPPPANSCKTKPGLHPPRPQKLITRKFIVIGLLLFIVELFCKLRQLGFDKFHFPQESSTKKTAQHLSHFPFPTFQRLYLTFFTFYFFLLSCCNQKFTNRCRKKQLICFLLKIFGFSFALHFG